MTKMTSGALLCWFLVAAATLAANAAAPRRQHATPDAAIDEHLRLESSLSVAKSPLEPITMATGAPDARNNELQGTQTPEASSTRLATRSTDNSDDQQENSASTKGIDEASGLAAESTTKSGSTSDESSQPTTTTETPPAETTTTQPEEETTTTTQSPSDQSTVASGEQPADKPKSGSETNDEDNNNNNKDQPTNSRDKEEESDRESTTSSTPEPETSTVTPTTTETPTTPPTTSTTATPAMPVRDSETEDSSEDQAAATTTTTEVPPSSRPSDTDTATAGFGTTQTDGTTSAPTTVTTTPSPPIIGSSIVPSTTEKPVDTGSSVVPLTITTEPEKPEAGKQTDDCNHLPTYDSEELQKVFREETTYRNGTIRGKFTYINYDQRYRLVHYTRLPYGPVKIDQVEELGRPERPNGSAARAPLAPNEIPNAMLQLRNILPNSLFGFPFVSPQQPRPQSNPSGTPASSYFYSTDSLHTPNLLSPSVPLSIPGGQHARPPTGDVLDTSNVDVTSLTSDSLGPRVTPPADQTPRPAKAHQQLAPAEPPLASSPPSHQFGLSMGPAPQHWASPADSKGIVYTYLPYMAPPPPSNHRALIRAYEQERQQQQQHFFHHQPHGHEHYAAPFMFAHLAPPSGQGEQVNKLRLRVKSSKSLNLSQAAPDAEHRAGTKSAQLRQSAPASGSRHQGPRQRFGKQNQELRAAPIKSVPVVYHVLQSPVQLQSARSAPLTNYALAFDHDD